MRGRACGRQPMDATCEERLAVRAGPTLNDDAVTVLQPADVGQFDGTGARLSVAVPSYGRAGERDGHVAVALRRDHEAGRARGRCAFHDAVNLVRVWPDRVLCLGGGCG